MIALFNARGIYCNRCRQPIGTEPHPPQPHPLRSRTQTQTQTRQDEIAFACAEGGVSRCKAPNQRAELKAFLKQLPAGSRIGMESTGSYHELLAEMAHKAGFVVF